MRVTRQWKCPGGTRLLLKNAIELFLRNQSCSVFLSASYSQRMRYFILNHSFAQSTWKHGMILWTFWSYLRPFGSDGGERHKDGWRKGQCNSSDGERREEETIFRINEWDILTWRLVHQFVACRPLRGGRGTTGAGRRALCRRCQCVDAGTAGHLRRGVICRGVRQSHLVGTLNLAHCRRGKTQCSVITKTNYFRNLNTGTHWTRYVRYREQVVLARLDRVRMRTT